MSSTSAFEFACRLDGKGGGRFGKDDLIDASASEGPLWVHLDFRSPEAARWVREESGVDALAARALLAEATRPRSVMRGDQMLADLRGVNLNPGATPDDMISLRMVLTPTKIITTRHRRLLTISDIRSALKRREGPRDVGSFLCEVVDLMTVRIADSVENLDDLIDALHERAGTESGSALRAELSDVRSQVISLRRYLAPQRDAISRMQTNDATWLNEEHRERLRETADRMTRHIEDLDAARDRAQLASEELTNRAAEQMNRTMYMLAIVAAIFLPLGLLTGLLGINVGGMPGEGDPHAFWIVCGALVGVAALQIWVFRKMRWL